MELQNPLNIHFASNFIILFMDLGGIRTSYGLVVTVGSLSFDFLLWCCLDSQFLLFKVSWEYQFFQKYKFQIADNQQQQQQLSCLFDVFGVGYMNQKRIMSGRVYGSAFSTHSYWAICLH